MIKTEIKIATIDLYNNERNEGMRCIKEIVKDIGSERKGIDVSYEVFETRYKGDIPGLDKDIYISSGGPGSPFEGEGTQWEKDYFNLIDKIWNYNTDNPEKKKHIFFICHSFQMAARYFKFGNVTKRPRQSFGIKQFTKTMDGNNDPVTKALGDPFYAADIRKFQVIEPDEKVIKNLGGKILSYEMVNNGNLDQPGLGAVRISDEIIATQFHPEADPESMLYHLKQDERKKQVVDEYGEERYAEMLLLLNKPEALKQTYKTVIPTFLNNAIDKLTAE